MEDLDFSKGHGAARPLAPVAPLYVPEVARAFFESTETSPNRHCLRRLMKLAYWFSFSDGKHNIAKIGLILHRSKSL